MTLNRKLLSRAGASIRAGLIWLCALGTLAVGADVPAAGSSDVAANVDSGIGSIDRSTLTAGGVTYGAFQAYRWSNGSNEDIAKTLQSLGFTEAESSTNGTLFRLIQDTPASKGVLVATIVGGSTLVVYQALGLPKGSVAAWLGRGCPPAGALGGLSAQDLSRVRVPVLLESNAQSLRDSILGTSLTHVNPGDALQHVVDLSSLPEPSWYCRQYEQAQHWIPNIQLSTFIAIMLGSIAFVLYLARRARQ